MSVATSSAAPAVPPRSALGLRLVGFLAGAALVVPMTSNVGGLAEIAHWWSQPIAVQKYVVWALLWESLGLTGLRPGQPAAVGGALYWLQTETLRLPPGHRFARWFTRSGRGTRRTPVDVALYLFFVCAAIVLLCSGATHGQPYDTLSKPVVLLVLAALTALGLRDRTAFLAARPEVYAVLLAVCLGPAGSLAFGLASTVVAVAGAEAAARMLGRSTMAPETVLLLAYVAAYCAHAGIRPGSAAGWALLPVAAVAGAGPLLHRFPMTLWIFADAAAEQRFAAAVVTPGTAWPRRAPAAAPGLVRAFGELLPRAVDDRAGGRLRDGALLARVTLGGAAPSGRRLLETVQHECDFPPGQLRVIEVAPAAWRSPARRYRILDAADGVLESGTVRTTRPRRSRAAAGRPRPPRSVPERSGAAPRRPAHAAAARPRPRPAAAHRPVEPV